jgi:6-phosphogluconolactonase
VKKGWFNVLLALAIGSVLLAGQLRAQFVFVANVGSNNVSAYGIDSKGALTPIPGSPFETGRLPRSVAVDPFSKFVYVANRGDDNISAYKISSTGALTPVPGSPFATGREPVSLAITKHGRLW